MNPTILLEKSREFIEGMDSKDVFAFWKIAGLAGSNIPSWEEEKETSSDSNRVNFDYCSSEDKKGYSVETVEDKRLRIAQEYLKLKVTEETHKKLKETKMDEPEIGNQMEDESAEEEQQQEEEDGEEIGNEMEEEEDEEHERQEEGEVKEKVDNKRHKKEGRRRKWRAFLWRERKTRNRLAKKKYLAKYKARKTDPRKSEIKLKGKYLFVLTDNDLKNMGITRSEDRKLFYYALDLLKSFKLMLLIELNKIRVSKIVKNTRK